jgi:endonuclease/exonuclease/phosphatase (EEP) superfamily protein YafD
MALIRYIITLGVLLVAVLQGIAIPLQGVHIFMLIHSLALPLTLVSIVLLLVLWFPWRGIAMLFLYNKQTQRIRWPALAFLAFIMGGLIYLRVQEPENPPTFEQQMPPEALRLASLNALHPNANLAPKLDFIRETHPDIMSIVEARTDWEKELPPLASTYPYHFVTRVASNYGTYDMILLSKYPTRRVLVQDEGRIVHYDIDGPRGTFRLVQVHPFSPVTPARHLARNAALAALAQVETTLPVVITGDFNTVPWQRDIKALMAHFDLKMAGWPAPTFPAYRMTGLGHEWILPPMVPLDYVLTPNGTTVHTSRTVHVPETDHLGVVVDITLPPR